MPDSQKLLILARRGIRATRDALAQDNMADLDEIRRQINERQAERGQQQPTLAELKQLIVQVLTELAVLKALMSTKPQT